MCKRTVMKAKSDNIEDIVKYVDVVDTMIWYESYNADDKITQ